MNEAMIRSNLAIAGYVEFHDPAGRPWTVMLRRPGERPWWSPFLAWSVTRQLGRRIVRDVTGDDTWNVELIPGVASPICASPRSDRLAALGRRRSKRRFASLESF